MCYRDMTFCPFWEKCKDGHECKRALTDEVKAGAKRWMPSIKDPPISIFTDKPECFKSFD